MNLFSHLIRSLFHQDHSNPHTQLTPDRDNGDSGSDLARVFAANRAEKLPELTVLSDRRPGPLDEFASQPFISPVRVIDPRSILSPVECSVGTNPKNPAS